MANRHLRSGSAPSSILWRIFRLERAGAACCIQYINPRAAPEARPFAINLVGTLRKFSAAIGTCRIDALYVNKLRKWWKLGVTLLLILVALQVGVGLLAHTARVRSFLTRQLETSFGRTVEVRSYSMSLFPTPQLDAKGITVGEDPAFGHEYFLRADRLSAGLRWRG